MMFTKSSQRLLKIAGLLVVFLTNSVPIGFSAPLSATLSFFHEDLSFYATQLQTSAFKRKKQSWKKEKTIFG